MLLNDVISLIDASRIINVGQFAKKKETGYQAFRNVTLWRDLGLCELKL